MSIFKFLTKKSTLICLGILLLLTFVPVDVWAANSQYGGGDPDKTGPFTAFLWRAAKLFMQTRNALFVLAAFAFIGYAWHAINDGSIEWKKILFLIVGLLILGVAGWIVSYMANPEKPDDVVTTYKNFGNSDGWD